MELSFKESLAVRSIEIAQGFPVTVFPLDPTICASTKDKTRCAARRLEGQYLGKIILPVWFLDDCPIIQEGRTLYIIACNMYRFGRIDFRIRESFKRFAVVNTPSNNASAGSYKIFIPAVESTALMRYPSVAMINSISS